MKSSSEYPQHVLLKEQYEQEEIAQKDTLDIQLAKMDDIENRGPQSDNNDQNDVIRIMRNYGEPYPRNFGKYCVFKFIDNEPSVAIGPHCNHIIQCQAISFPLFLLAFSVLMFAGYKLIQFSILNLPILFQFVSIFLSLTLLASYATTALANPGIASAQFSILNEDDIIGQKRYCKPCQILRPKGTTHCFDCDVCIKNLDHHCPWTGKCIGSGNLRSFYLFIMSMMAFMIYSILIAFSHV